MLRKITFAIVGTLFVAGVATAAPPSPFPMSVNESGPNYGGIATERAADSAAASIQSGGWQIVTPASVNETGPNYPAVATERSSPPRRATAASAAGR